MGQKVNPHGLRVGVIKDWDSRWFASKKDFSDNLVEDHKIRTELKALLKDAGVPKIEIERTVDSSTSAPRVTVSIYCAKPGMVIGKGGEERVALQSKLSKEYGKNVLVNVIEVKSPSTNAQLVAEDIARQLENRVTFRRAMKQCIRNAMSPRDAPSPQRASRPWFRAVWLAPTSPAPRATTRAPSPCRPCAPTSTTASLRLPPPTAASASRCGSTRARSSRARRTAKTAPKKEGGNK